MTTRAAVPALGADGWFSTEGEPHLIGVQCATCGTYAFPPTASWCPNPACRGTDLAPTRLSRRGRIWSYTDAQYQPPAPFVFDGDDFTPFAIAAVHLETEGLVILGQLVPGVGVEDVAVGDEVDVTVGTLFGDDEHDYQIWRWQPVEGAA